RPARPGRRGQGVRRGNRRRGLAPAGTKATKGLLGGHEAAVLVPPPVGHNPCRRLAAAAGRRHGGSRANATAARAKRRSAAAGGSKRETRERRAKPAGARAGVAQCWHGGLLLVLGGGDHRRHPAVLGRAAPAADPQGIVFRQEAVSLDQATGAHSTSSICGAPLASITRRSSPSALPALSGMPCASAARKSSSIGYVTP